MLCLSVFIRGQVCRIPTGGLTSLLDFDLIGDDPHQLGLATGGRLGLYALAQRVDLRVGQQGLLPAQGGLEFVGQRQPMLAGCGFQGAERTDGAMAGSGGGGDGFDQEVVGVGLTADGFARRFQEHFVPIYTESEAIARKIFAR